MKEGSPVALSIMDPDNPYRYLQIRGKVSRMTEQGADAHINSLAKKYLDQDKYPFSRPDEVRVTFEIERCERRAGDGVPAATGENHGDARQIAAAVSGRVEIMRDRAGVSAYLRHRHADLFFGLGVATAQDRLWQMDRLRRRALGRQAEILGAAYVASDVAHLTVGIDLIAEREAAAMDAATRALIDRFVAGINRQIEHMGTTCRRNSACWTMRRRPSPCATSWRSAAASGGR